MANKKVAPQKDKLTCLGKCHETKAANSSNFYTNKNPLFDHDNFHVCKKCITEYIGEKDTKGYLDRVILVLSMLNRPFLADVWESRNQNWQDYIPVVSSFKKDLTYADSVFSNYDKYSVNISKDVEIVKAGEKPVFNDNADILQVGEEELIQLQLFWGKGFKIDEYIYLEGQYDMLTSRYQTESYAQEMLFQEIAHKMLEIRKLREANKPTDKETKTLQDLLGSSNIKPVQETGANDAEQATLGVLIKKYENEKPIPEPDPAWADVDGIMKYIKVWFLGHLSKMRGEKNENSELYEQEISKYKVQPPAYDAEGE